MDITFTFHGRLTELVAKQSETLTVRSNTAAMLRKELIHYHPELNETTFQLAQELKIIQGDDRVSAQAIDVFPPFSGG